MSLLDLLEKEASAEPPAAIPQAQSKPASLVPRALLNKSRPKASPAKIAKPVAPLAKKPASTQNSTLNTTENSALGGIGTLTPTQNTSQSAAEDLVSISALTDLYDPHSPSNYYVDVYIPRMELLASEEKEEAAHSREDFQTSSIAPESSHTSGLGAQMLFKQGWKGSGHGLGKHEQGMATPLVGTSESTFAGSSRAVGSVKRAEVQEEASRVLLLRNMAERGRVDEDLRGEVETVCAAFGVVLDCQVIESTSEECDQEDSVRIFVQFQSTKSARAAKSALSGRRFDDRPISAHPYPEAALKAGQLWLPMSKS